ncbi:MAG: phosphoribosyl-ATP diphosphatase [Erysipelotrichaceae bacterium]
MDAIKREYDKIIEKKDSTEEGSYTKYLFDKGIEKVVKKVGEEATEVVIAAIKNDKEELIGEVCDLTYHVLVAMATCGVTLEDVEAELDKRAAKENNFKGERKEIINR